MASLTITAKRQLTLRRELLVHLGVSPGDKLLVETKPDGRIEIRADRPSGSITDLFGILKDENGPRLSVQEIGAITARGWAGKR